jgi:hypothetical protein
MQHAPTTDLIQTWKVVSSTADSVTAFAICRCGDDNCYFTATIYKDRWIHTEGR